MSRQNFTVAEPTMADLLNLTKRDVMFQLNCHALATIRAVDLTAQTVTAEINYPKTFLETAQTGVPFDSNVSYPPLVDMPFIIIQGAAAALTMPIAVGDTCLILFNDRDMDNWLHSGQNGPVRTQRLHAFSDGIALIGVNSSQRAIASYDTARAVLRNGDASVGVGTTKVQIKNTTKNLNTILQNLITTIENITTTPAVVGVPCTVSAASISALSAVAADLGGLLE